MPAPPRLPQRRHTGRRAAVIVLALPALVLGAGCTRMVSGRPQPPASPSSSGTGRRVPASPPSSPPSSSPASSPAGSAAGALAPRVYRVFSDHPGFVVTSRQAGSTVRWRAGGVSWTHTFYPPAAGAAPVIDAVAAPGASFIQCTVTTHGVAVARIRSGGPDARVTCS